MTQVGRGRIRIVVGGALVNIIDVVDGGRVCVVDVAIVVGRVSVVVVVVVVVVLVLVG